MPSAVKPLTAQQQLFVAHYNKSLNATAAAKAAGYADAKTKGCKLLKDPRIAALIKEVVEAKLERAELTADRVLEEMRRLAFFDIRRLYHPDGSLKAVHELDDDAASAVLALDIVLANVEAGDGHIDRVLKVKLHDKVRALEMLGKHFAILKEIVDHTHRFVVLDQEKVAQLSDAELEQLAAAARVARALTAGEPKK